MSDLQTERDAVLRELQDRTNQTWLVKRKRWALLVLRQSDEISRLRHNEAVMMDSLYKACGDDEETVRQTIESQGMLRPEPGLLTRCPTGKCADPARDCYGSGCMGPNVGAKLETAAAPK